MCIRDSTQRAYALAMQYGGQTNYEGFHTLDAEWDFLSAAPVSYTHLTLPTSDLV